MIFFLGGAHFSPLTIQAAYPSQATTRQLRQRDEPYLVCQCRDGDFLLSMLCNLIVLSCH